MKSSAGTVTGLALAVLVGCSTSPGVGGGPTATPTQTPNGQLPPAEKADTGQPANYACASSADPHPGGADIQVEFVVVEQPLTGAPPLATGMTLQRIDPATGSPIGAASPDTLTLPSNGRVALELTSTNPDYLPTYYFNYVTPGAPPPQPMPLLVIPINVRDAFVTYYGLNPAGVPTAVSGTVVDCDGDMVKNALVEASGATLVGYTAGGSPDPNAILTDADGTFVGLFGGGVATTFIANAYLGSGSTGPPEVVGESDVAVELNTATILTLDPLHP